MIWNLSGFIFEAELYGNMETEFPRLRVKVLRVWSKLNWQEGKRETMVRFRFHLSTFQNKCFSPLPSAPGTKELDQEKSHKSAAATQLQKVRVLQSSLPCAKSTVQGEKNWLHLQDEKKLYLALAGLWTVRSAQEVKSNAPASNQIVDACWVLVKCYTL